VAAGQEGADHVIATDPAERDTGQQVAGVVIEPVQDLDTGAVGQLPVSEV
jgi:hypothetical protein